MGRPGVGGSLAWVPSEQARAVILEAVIESEGRLVLAAHQLGYARSHLYRLIKQHTLWPAVNKVRLNCLQRKRRRMRRHGVSNR